MASHEQIRQERERDAAEQAAMAAAQRKAEADEQRRQEEGRTK